MSPISCEGAAGMSNVFMTYNDAAFYPHVHLFIQPDLDP